MRKTHGPALRSLSRPPSLKCKTWRMKQRPLQILWLYIPRLAVKALSSADQQSLFDWSPDPFGVAHLGLECHLKEVLLDLDANPQVPSALFAIKSLWRMVAPPNLGALSLCPKLNATGSTGKSSSA